MVIESQDSKVRYQGNGLGTEWPVPFPVLREEHLHLIVTSSDGLDTPVNSNYEITGIQEGNISVTYPVTGVALPSGFRLTIYRELPLVQQLDLENGGNFNAEVIEQQFDSAVMQIQQIQEHCYVIMDRAYEGNETQALVKSLGHSPVVPPNPNRLEPWDYDREMYKKRNEIERLFRRMKGFRRLATRFDKLDVVFIAFIHFALIFEAPR